MTHISRKQSVENIERAVDENTARLAWWLRYSEYELIPDGAGRKYLRANEAKGVAEYAKPLSSRSADLFLRFARWPEDPGMDESLAGERNAAAAKTWAEMYGVLGLNPPDTASLTENPLRRITAGRLAPRGHVYIPSSRYQNSGLGGPPNESVENFALEAWDAHIALRLYEALNTPTRSSLETIRGFMSAEQGSDLPSNPYVERDTYGRDEDSTLRWAQETLTFGIESKVRDACYPTVEGYEYVGDKAKQGWGFKSLLGAMWLQMLWLVAEPPRVCLWCGRTLSGRKDKQYCSDKCKGDWNYHEGKGKSGKTPRKHARLRKDK
ncbi:hypothetical protein BH24ACT20_BH24ACT20_01190 [soil metagenome]